MLGQNFRLRSGVANIRMGVLNQVDLPLLGRFHDESGLDGFSTVDTGGEGYFLLFVNSRDGNHQAVFAFFKVGFQQRFASIADHDRSGLIDTAIEDNLLKSLAVLLETHGGVFEFRLLIAGFLGKGKESWQKEESCQNKFLN